MQIAVRPATIETRHDFSSIVEDANAWQKALGSEGWTHPFDDVWMLPRIERGELYLAYAGAAPVSAFRILWEDHPFWDDREIGDSIYLHTFAVQRSRAGLGIGSAVIGEVVRMGRERGRANVRLDCFRSNTRLIAFYERNGFASVGLTSMMGKAMNLMERTI
ncbi:GNAT family N-acetyltransferase [Sphingomonas populi]|uniref:GNAT family N-acetyltransferase n=1 Tax=Sphingomonas populi TaxID=2484750 RepID=A0A4Q6XS60_9SPHN|nr:GNAT family N-acetyltransferase [Sphingomonas populi]RZF59096.1 GNAT family N-acetyltransferase [Sphingomonas populi]